MKKILVVGAGFLQMFVIKKARELGYYVLAIDRNPNAQGFEFSNEYKCIDIVDKKACLKYAKEKMIDGVMTAATDFGVLTAAYIAEELGLPGLNYRSASLVKNKYLVRKRLFERQVDDTKQVYEIKRETNLLKLGDICFPVMVKPCDGSGSRGTTKVSCIEELKEACDFAIGNSPTQRAEIETFITGQEYGVESLVANGKIYVMAVMRKWMTNPPYYAELGHAIPSGLSREMEDKIIDCVKRAIQALEINFGAVNMDLIVTEKDKLHIIDVGARMGGNLIGSHIIWLGTGIDYLANLIKATVDDPIHMKPLHKSGNVATRLLDLDPGVVTALPEVKEIEQKNKVEILHHLRVGDVIKEYQTNLDGCGYVVATAESMAEAIANAEKAREQMNYEIQRG